MRASFDINRAELDKFEAVCDAAIQNVGNSSRLATVDACEEIMLESSIQVPKDTWTMAASGYYEIKRRGDRKGYAFEAVMGYGGNGNPVNPKTGKTAASYMVQLHEDMSVSHQNGKAKFLEDPVRDYAANKFYRTIFDYASRALADFK